MGCKDYENTSLPFGLSHNCSIMLVFISQLRLTQLIGSYCINQRLFSLIFANEPFFFIPDIQSLYPELQLNKNNHLPVKFLYNNKEKNLNFHWPTQLQFIHVTIHIDNLLLLLSTITYKQVSSSIQGHCT